jgi:group I intron endonuclease
MIGIYSITNLIDGKVYIGQSTKIKDRLAIHARKLRGNRHENRYLQAAWNKHGESNFRFGVLCLSNKEGLDWAEQYFIALHQANNPAFGYNLESGGNKFKTHSEETKKKISIQNTGRKHTEEERKKMSDFQKGRVPWNKGKKMPIEAVQKAAESRRGQKYRKREKGLSEETKRKMSLSHMGKRNARCKEVDQGEIAVAADRVLEVAKKEGWYV